MASSKQEYLKEKEEAILNNNATLTELFRSLLKTSFAKKNYSDFYELYTILNKYLDSKPEQKKLSKYLQVVNSYDGHTESDTLSKDELLAVSQKIDEFLSLINTGKLYEQQAKNPLNGVHIGPIQEDIIIHKHTSATDDEIEDTKTSISFNQTEHDSSTSTYDMIQYYTAGKVRKKDRQLVFVNREGDSFFMKAGTFLDLLNNLGVQRLVKKYNKQKEGYIGGEVVGQVNLIDGVYYEFLLGFGPQNQLITSESKLQVHKYILEKHRIDLYYEFLTLELSEEKKFLELLNEADHTTKRRYQIDLKKCFEEQNIPS